MAEKKSSVEGDSATVVTSSGVETTEFVVEMRPDLPQVGVDVSREEPVIQRVLLDVRKDEADRNAKVGQ